MLVVFIGLFYWYVISPKAASLHEAQSQLVSAQQTRSELIGSIAKLQTLIKQLREHYIDIDRLDEALPLTGSGIRTQLLIGNLAKSSGVSVGDIAVNGLNTSVAAGNKALLQNPYQAKRTLNNLTVTVSAAGSYDQLKLFLQKIEQNARIMNISSLEIGGYKENQLNLSLNLETYYFSPSPTSP